METQIAEVAGRSQPARRIAGRALLSVRSFVRRKPLGAMGLLIVLVAGFAAVFGNLVAPMDPYAIRVEHTLQSPSRSFLLGTDDLGRDIFSRMVIGARVSLFVGFATMLLAATTGLVVGVSSAYLGGKFDLIVQRFVDGLSAIPALVLALALVAALQSSVFNVVLAIAIVQVPRFTRVIRSAAMAVRENAYIEAAKAIGCTSPRIMMRHVAPNIFAPLIIVATASIGATIITESTLSFLGVGVPIRTISWGAMLSGDTQKFFTTAPWMALGPGLALTLTVFGINVFGDALRDVLDPRLRGR
ncbi:MAG: ABC transporter permease [Chloroflexi bacterium]|nr:ABC transporter permease [Chloroflexota bacterium]